MKNYSLNLLLLASLILISACSNNQQNSVLNHKTLAIKYFNEDAKWYEDNIPFFECSDKNIEQVYYYRWKLYKAHIRNVGTNKYVITEFINHVPWDRDPYCTINAASMHHIYEGRWLRDQKYLDGYINNLLQEGGNNRRYSESITDASYARYLVNADKDFIVSQLDSMVYLFNQWYDHCDSTKNMYYIPAMNDATEYTIASIDASGGKDGFEDGEAFRPTINSYMYANALAIAKIAELSDDKKTSNDFYNIAKELKENVQQNLWNESFQHFTDRYKVDNQFVHYWDFIRGRELAGFAPWYFSLPDNDEKYFKQLDHLLDTTKLLGKFGLRTNEPSYEYYFHNFLMYEGKPGSQWNGPSWPYQTSQAITGMANLINNYNQNVVSNSDYLNILRLFTQQHFLPDGKLNIVENYDPNNGGPIVHYYWSNHYLHSSYNNLIISGLCGIRPSDNKTLTINPLVDESIKYFCLSNLKYHGHDLTVVYDADGTKYNLGSGLTVFLDGEKVEINKKQNKYFVEIGKPKENIKTTQSTNFALNINYNGFPKPSASVNDIPDSINQAFDGRIWYFPEIRNRWATIGSTSNEDWLAVDFGEAKEISSIKIYPFTDKNTFALPDEINIEYLKNGKWNKINIEEQIPNIMIGNTENCFKFSKVSSTSIRVTFKHTKKHFAISEIECY